MIGNQKKSQIVKMLSLIFRANVKMGHELEYHQAVSQAAASLGWEHWVGASKAWSTAAKELPHNWEASLESAHFTGSRSILKRSRQILIAAGSLHRFFAKHSTPSGSETILIESFLPSEIIAVTLGLLGLRNRRISVWLLFRFNEKWTSIGYIFLRRILFPILELLVGGRVALMTDNEPLRISVGEAFRRRQVFLLPIPHGVVECRNIRKSSRKDGEIVCWLPGPPRKDKGVEIARSLLSMATKESSRITFLIGEGARVHQVQGAPILKTVPDFMERDIYEATLMEVDVVLLPYDRRRYEKSTSGIFVEAITAGKVPLVTQGTWMAFELERFGLGELCLDWDPECTLKILLDVVTNLELRDRLAKMRSEYVNYHSLQSFTKVIQEISAAAGY